MRTAILFVAVTAGVARSDTVVQFDLNGRVNGPNGIIDNFQVQLFDSQAPITVDNFLRYVTGYVYDNTIIHRDVPGFVMQGGGFAPAVDGQGMITALNPVTSFGAIQNEYSPTRSNLRGTIAMAKVGGNENSATNQWFVNLADNSANLDGQNGGFTVFGHVIGDGMTLIDAASGLPQYNLNPYFDPNYSPADPTAGPFAQVPLFNNGSTFVTVTSARIINVFWAPAAGSTGGQGQATDSWNSTTAKWAVTAGVQGSGRQGTSGPLIFSGAAGTVTVDGTVNVVGGMTFSTTGYNIAPGTAAIIRLTGAAADNIITTDSGVTATIGAPLSGTAGMTKAGAGTLVLTAACTYAGVTTVSSGVLELGIDAQNVVNGTSGRRADITAGKIVFDGASTALETQIGAELKKSYATTDANRFAATNNGLIYSSTAQAAGRALGWASEGGKVTVMYTLYGDATLDGVVNFDDLSKVLTNYNSSGTWATGDVTYDGVVNFDDLSKILTAYNTGLGAGEQGGSPTFATAGDFAVVPEPSSVVLLVAGLLGLLAYTGRRRRG